VQKGELSKPVAGRILRAKVGSSDKNVKIIEVEQCHVIKFFSDEAMPGVQIIERIRQHYGQGACS
jgi:hypothetical protein